MCCSMSGSLTHMVVVYSSDRSVVVLGELAEVALGVEAALVGGRVVHHLQLAVLVIAVATLEVSVGVTLLEPKLTVVPAGTPREVTTISTEI